MNEIVKSIKEKGFFMQKNFLSSYECEKILECMKDLSKNHYTDENLNNRSAYISEQCSTRNSYAFMVNEENKSEKEFLPVVSLNNIEHQIVSKYLGFYHGILSEFSGIPIDSYSRSMLNIQFYKGESKPVREHYDGDILYAETDGENNLKIKEALLPSLVMVLVLENENTEDDEVSGVYLRKVGEEKHIAPHLPAGSMIIFDNINYRHGVPKMTKPRTMIGFRNFDHSSAKYFTSEEPDVMDKRCYEWKRLEDKYNAGWVRDCKFGGALRIAEFNENEWVNIKEEHFKREVIF